MKLTLRIENLDYLPDGGPLEFTANARGFEVGRDPAMDWTLPDPTRHISSRHFEVVYRDRQFLLNDISTNGTFQYGASMRVSSPLQLSHNDRLQVGQYIIRVVIEAPAVSVPPVSAQSSFAQPAPAQPSFAQPSFAQPSFAQPSFAAPDPYAAPAPAAPAADPWSLAPTPAPMPVMAPPPRQPDPVPQPVTAPPVTPGPLADSFPGAARPMMPPTAPPAPPHQITAPPAPISEPFAPRPVTAPPQAAAADALPFLDAICKGAGLPPGSLANVDVARLGEEIGKSLRISTEELMALLGARAAAKQFVKSSSRTMIGGVNNSPLKFKPNAVEAMLTMFAQRSESYLLATEAFKQGFDDIKRHQTAVYAAMQPALARLLEDLSPESIEERSTGGLMSSKKARAWELFVERWDAKTHPYENGMLDVFLTYFAEAYDEAVKKTGG